MKATSYIKAEYEKAVMQAILEAASNISGLSVGELKERRRFKQLVYWRGLAQSAARFVFEGSYRLIGEAFGQHHATTINAIRQINRRINDSEPGSTIRKDYNRMTWAMIAGKKNIKLPSNVIVIHEDNRDQYRMQSIDRQRDEMVKALTQTAKETSIKDSPDYVEAGVPDWNRIEEAARFIGLDAAIQQMKAWLDSNEGKVIPKRVTE
jgi:hypothetical protein